MIKQVRTERKKVPKFNVLIMESEYLFRYKYNLSLTLTNFNSSSLFKNINMYEHIMIYLETKILNIYNKKSIKTTATTVSEVDYIRW